MNYLKNLLTLIIGGGILVGIPVYFHSPGLLCLSWIPALFAMAFLQQD
jgi:hypothetical protein